MNQLKSNPIKNGVSPGRRHLEARRCRKTRWRHPRTPLPVLFPVPFQREPGPTEARRFRLHRFHPRDRFEPPGNRFEPPGTGRAAGRPGRSGARGAAMLYGRKRVGELPLPVWQPHGNRRGRRDSNEKRGDFGGRGTARGGLRGLEGRSPPPFLGDPIQPSRGFSARGRHLEAFNKMAAPFVPHPPGAISEVNFPANRDQTGHGGFGSAGLNGGARFEPRKTGRTAEKRG